MFARLQTLNQPAEKLDSLVKFAREQFTAAPPLQGFRGFYYLVDRDNEKGLVMTLWETEDDIRRVEENNSTAREQLKSEARLESPQSEIFEVAFQAS